MYDVEFLRMRPDFGQTLIYRYRSGILRNRIEKTIIALAARDSWLCWTKTPQEYACNMVSVFDDPTIKLCDFAGLSLSKTEGASTWLDLILEVIASGEHERSVLFVPVDSPLTQRPSWPAVLEGCFVIDEVEIDRDTLPLALRYLEATTDLANEPALLAQPGFVDSFEDLFEHGTPDLFTLMRAFDDRVLTCTDPETNQYDPRHQRRNELAKRGRASPRRRLRALLTNRDGWSVTDLVCALDERRWRGGLTPVAVTRELYRITSKLLSPSMPTSVRGSGYAARATARLGRRKPQALECALWAAVLLSWEARLAGTVGAPHDDPSSSADLLVVSADQLGHEFLARLDGDEHADRLAGLWKPLTETLSTLSFNREDKLASARRELVTELARSVKGCTDLVGPPWVARLRRCLDGAVLDAERAESELIEGVAGEIEI